jgi:hypothetical protein
VAATTALVVSAAAAAYSAKKQADASNKAAKAANAPQEFSRTNLPYMNDALQGPIQAILQRQADLFNNSAPPPAASPSSGNMPTNVTPKPKPAAPVPAKPAANPPAFSGGKTYGGYTSAQLAADPSLVMKLGVNARQAYLKSGGSSTPAPASGSTTPAPNLNSANGVLSEVARQALGAGKSPMIDDATNFTRGTLNSTNFTGRNDILSDLTDRLGNASFDDPTNMLKNFLGGSYGAEGSGPAKAGGSGGGGGGASRGYSGGGGYSMPGGGAYGFSGGAGGGSAVPDATGYGTFGTEIRGVLDAAKKNPADDPNVQALIESLKRESLEGHQRSVADLDARSEASGRFGGGAWADARSLANEEYDEGLQGQIANVYVGQRQSALDRAMQALGLVNNRDIASMSDATQREGIAASSAASSAGLSAQMDLARRGQDLDAINSLLKHQEFGLSTLGSLGSQLSDDQFKALGAVGDISNIGLSGLNIAGNAGSAMAGLQGSLASSNAQRSIANSALNFEKQKYQDALPQQQIDNYLRTIGLIGGMGGTQFGVNPGANTPTVNSTAAALMGGVGGGLSAYGALNGGH